MKWLKSVFAIIFFVGVMCFLPFESIAQVATAKAITIEETKTEAVTYTYEQLLQYKKQLENAIASVSKKQAELEQVNLMIAQIEAEKAKSAPVKQFVSEKLTQLRQRLGVTTEVVK